MNVTVDEAPKTLADLSRQTDATGRWFQAMIGPNLGRTTLKFNMSLRDFIDLSEVANRTTISSNAAFAEEFHAQRTLITEHAVGLARYTLMGLVRHALKKTKTVTTELFQIRDELGDPAYVSLQPIVCNLRSAAPDGSDLLIRDVGERVGIKTGAFEVLIGHQNIMWVVDGQHRRAGFDRVLDFLKKVTQSHKYPSKGLFVPSNYHGEVIDHGVHAFWSKILEAALAQSTISVECHLGLKEEEEQQLFYDLNAKGKAVGRSYREQYDHSDPINKFISEELIEENLLGFKLSERDVTDWQKDDGAITRKDVMTVTCLLCLGKTNSKSGTPAIVENRREYLRTFWNLISHSEGFGKPGAKSSTVLAQPVVIKSLAKLGYDLTFGHSNMKDPEAYRKICEAIKFKELDFSHENELWQVLFWDAKKREQKFPGISDFVHVPEETNLDAGLFDAANKWVRFGSRHNDIYPRLGDAIRYQLKLSPRPSVTKLIEKSKTKDMLEMQDQ